MTDSHDMGHIYLYCSRSFKQGLKKNNSQSRVGPLVLLTVGVLPATGAAPNGDDIAGAAQADDVAASAAAGPIMGFIYILPIES